MSTNINDMTIIRTECYEEHPFKGRGIGLGVFDGFHLGHRELVGRVISQSRKLELVPSIFTFSDHPAYRTGDEKKLSRGLITTASDKHNLLVESGVQEIILQNFTEEFALMSPLDFLQHLLYEILHVRLIVVGFNYRFGKDRAGDSNFISEWAKEKEVEVIVVDPVVYEGVGISSSQIRETITSGEIEKANAMLGRKYTMTGVVQSGQKLGRKMGFPTANLKPDPCLCIPGNGVYITRTLVGERYYDSLTNVGIRPSVPGVLPDPILETLVLDRNIDLYGKPITVYFLKYLRPEKKFEGLADLIEQIRYDESLAREFHENAQEMFPVARIGNVEIYGTRSRRFSSNYLEVCFKMPLSLEIAACNTLLSRIMTCACAKFPTRPALAKHLDYHYGAILDHFTEIQGDIHSTSFMAEALHTFEPGEKPFDQIATLLFEILGEPDHENYRFDEELIESERTALLSEIESLENDKHRYAYERSLDVYTEGSVYGILNYGSADAVRSITADGLRKAYRNLIQQAHIRIFLAGHYTELTLNELCKHTENVFKNNDPLTRIIPAVHPGVFIADDGIREVTEKKEVLQTKVCMIYSIPVTYFSQRILTLSVFNMMLGGDVHSLLFQKVREEQGLAYHVFSAPLKYLSGVSLMAGVSHENADIAVEEMSKQVQIIAEGRYEEELFKNSIQSIEFIYRSIPDSLHSIVRFYANQWVRGIHLTPSDSLKFLESVTGDDVIRLAKDANLKVVYRLINNKVNGES
jgi:riboflavin kinase / FMN adenylyltransferase